eukprot:1387306-Amorphochlora_amoeboformis.AAC.1
MKHRETLKVEDRIGVRPDGRVRNIRSRKEKEMRKYSLGSSFQAFPAPHKPFRRTEHIQDNRLYQISAISISTTGKPPQALEK